MEPNYLLDSFRVTGETLRDFKQAAREVDKNTSLVTLNFQDAQVYNFLSENNGIVKYNVFSSGNNFNISNTGAMIVGKTANVRMNSIQQIYPNFFHELTRINKTVFRLHMEDEDSFFFFGETFFKTFSAQTSCIGGSLLKEPSIERDIALARVFDRTFKVNALVRTSGKINKIFGVFSDKFYRVPLEDIAYCVKHFKEAEVKFWEINQKEAQIYFEFPHLITKHKNPSIVPGIRIVTSDTGYSSTDVDLCFRNVNGKVDNFHRVKKVSFKHTKKVSRNDLVDEIESSINELASLTENFLGYRESLENVSVKGINAYKRTINELLAKGKFKEKMGIRTQKIVVAALVDNAKTANMEIKKSKLLDRLISIPDENKDITDYQKDKFRDVIGDIIRNVT